MPSVMTTTSGSAASIASTTAALANLGGTKTTETSAPVAATASWQESNTGMSRPSAVTVWPPLPGVTPATMFACDPSMRIVCLVPSEPVMPWTRILEFSVRKIAIGVRPPGPRARPRGARHRPSCRPAPRAGCPRRWRICRPRSALLPSRRTTSGLVTGSPLSASICERLHDAVGDRVARGDAAEDVDEDGLDLGVAEDDLEAVGHDLRRGAAADVEEVRRLLPAELLARVGHDVERAHHEARAVADDPDRAGQLDVVEVLLPAP